MISAYLRNASLDRLLPLFFLQQNRRVPFFLREEAIFLLFFSAFTLSTWKQWPVWVKRRYLSLLFKILNLFVFSCLCFLVGRADALCGLFYFISMALYVSSIRGSLAASSPAHALGLASCGLCAIIASFSKEIGITGMLVNIHSRENLIW